MLSLVFTTLFSRYFLLLCILVLEPLAYRKIGSVASGGVSSQRMWSA